MLEEGRPLTQMGAHCLKQNQDSIGVCYVGTAKPTPAQLTTILDVYHMLWNQFQIPYERWFGHYEFDMRGKTCPGLYMLLVRDWLRHFHEAQGFSMPP